MAAFKVEMYQLAQRHSLTRSELLAVLSAEMHAIAQKNAEHEAGEE